MRRKRPRRFAALPGIESLALRWKHLLAPIGLEEPYSTELRLERNRKLIESGCRVLEACLDVGFIQPICVHPVAPIALDGNAGCRA